MATKSKTFQSNHDGPITVSVQGRSPIQFVPGEVRTVETDDPAVIEALKANSDVSEVKASKKK